MDGMEVFCHHIYEYEKGLRNLILHTRKIEHKEEVEDRLNRRKIAYFISNITDKRINVFFGNRYCKIN